MSKLLVVRHAQASFMAKDYDELSDFGHQQSAALGQYLVERGVQIDHIVIGPLKRHLQTAQHIKEAFIKNGKTWNAVFHPAFEEHLAPEITRHFLEKQNKNSKHQEIKDAKAHKKQYFKAFEQLFKQWIKDELDLSDTNFEKWSVFKNKVITGLKEVMEEHDDGGTTAIFTSGGTTSVITGAALGLPDEKTVELSWQIQNTSVTEFLFSKGRFTLKSFNNIAHLKPEWATLV